MARISRTYPWEGRLPFILNAIRQEALIGHNADRVDTRQESTFYTVRKID
jgi:hypothetical protein